MEFFLANSAPFREIKFYETHVKVGHFRDSCVLLSFSEILEIRNFSQFAKLNSVGCQVIFFYTSKNYELFMSYWQKDTKKQQYFCSAIFFFCLIDIMGLHCIAQNVCTIMTSLLRQNINFGLFPFEKHFFLQIFADSSFILVSTLSRLKLI